MSARVGISQETPLTLEEAISRVLANNRDIETGRIDRQISQFGVTAAEGAYDPRVGVAGSWDRQISPVSSLIGGAAGGKLTQKNSTFAPHIRGMMPWLGGSYQLDFASTRLTTDNQFVTLNPQYPTSLSFSFTQPLLRGLRFDVRRRSLEIAKKNRSLTDEVFRQRVIELVTQAERSYWELVFAVRNLQIQVEADDLARRQLESNQRMAREGILAPIDVVEAQTQLATFEQNVYRAQEWVTRAENTLKTLMLKERSEPLWSSALLPVTPMNLDPPGMSLEHSVRQALANRPELAQVEIAAKINETDSRYLREETKPQVDLIASYSSAGLAGRLLPPGPNPLTGGFDAFLARINDLSRIQGLPPLPPVSFGDSAVPDLLVGGYGQSLSNLWNRNFPTVRVDLRISLPLRNRSAEADLASSLAEGRRIRTQRERAELLIESDVRNVLQSVESARARLSSAAVARRSAEEQYESEQRKFQAGTSTVFLVLQRQTTMITTRSQEIRAQVDLSQAIAELERATAGTLRVHRIDIRKSG